jgi:glycosyltransferase involved in cell wall biosynthesis
MLDGNASASAVLTFPVDALHVTDAASHPPKVSIVISNFNYGRFLGDAIDSALAQTYANTEVIVVDDGSTDNSAEVIERRGDRVLALFKANGGQASAFNVGFQASTGDLILFLDSDDVLEPKAVEAVVREWRDGTVRTLFPLTATDKNGKQLGRRVGGNALPSPLYGSFGVGSPTSGNVFARSALEKIMPIPESVWRVCPDFYLTAVNLFGDVGCLRQPLASYRLHGSNNLACADPLAVIRNRLFLDLQLYDVLAGLTDGKIAPLKEWIGGCPQHWVRRIISLRKGPKSHPWKDRLFDLTVRAIEATWRQPDRNFRRRLAYSIFVVAYSTLPRKAIGVLQAIDAGERDPWIRRLLGA